MLHCFVAVDLKTGKFVPEHVGKMKFYLSVIDDKLKSDIDNPSIGLILCKDKNKVVAEYSLKDMIKLIGVSEYMYTIYKSTIQLKLKSSELLDSYLME